MDFAESTIQIKYGDDNRPPKRRKVSLFRRVPCFVVFLAQLLPACDTYTIKIFHTLINMIPATLPIVLIVCLFEQTLVHTMPCMPCHAF